MSEITGGDYPDEQVPARRRRVAENVLALLAMLRSGGATQAETSEALGLGHGSASGALTRLHRGDQIARLTERRGGQYVYVHRDHAGGRALSTYTPHKGTGTNIRINRRDVESIAAQTRYGASFPTVVTGLVQWLRRNGVQVDD